MILLQVTVVVLLLHRLKVVGVSPVGLLVKPYLSHIKRLCGLRPVHLLVPFADAWLSNYAFGVGHNISVCRSRFAVGNVEANFVDFTSVNGNSSGVVTATTFSGSGASLTSIPNSALDNSSVSYGGISLSLGGS